MTLVFDGTPQQAPGLWNGGTNWADPPWYDTWIGPLGTTSSTGQNPIAFATDRIQIKNDAFSRFPGVSYWEFKCAPGDTFAGESGEKCRLRRPFYSNPEFPFEGANRVGRQPTGPWGRTLYDGGSFYLDPTILTPFNFCNFHEIKMSQSAPNGIMLGINQGNLIATGDPQIRLYLSVLAGPTDSGGEMAGYKYNFDKGHILTSTTKGVWYDYIIGWVNEMDSAGWVTLWLKLATDSTWTEYPVIVNDFTCPWWQPSGELTGQWRSYGIYRGSSPSTTIVKTYGPFVATTWADIATTIYGAAPPAPPTGVDSVSGPSSTLEILV